METWRFPGHPLDSVNQVFKNGLGPQRSRRFHLFGRGTDLSSLSVRERQHVGQLASSCHRDFRRQQITTDLLPLTTEPRLVSR